MCSVFLAIDEFEDYPVVLMSNRDEFLDRPAQAIHSWDDGSILAGKDLKAGGTWLAIDPALNFALVTNFRAPQHMGTGELSRGELPLKALHSGDIKKWLRNNYNRYGGFNLLHYYNNKLHWMAYGHEWKEEVHKKGVFGLSNAYLNSPWPKVEKGKNWLREAIKGQEFSIDQALEFLSDKSIARDTELPQTGVPIEWERKLSALNIRHGDYGTRVSTVLLIDKDSTARVSELNRITGKRKTYTIKRGGFELIEST